MTRRPASKWALAVATVAMPVAILVIAATLSPPEQGGAMGELRSWCVGAEPDAWRAALVVGLAIAAVAALLVAARREIVELAARRPQALLARATVILALSGAGVMALAATSPARAHLVAPPVGSRPALDLMLVDQAGAPTAVASLRGHVVLATGFYARCSTTCPMAFAQVHRVLSRLTDAERSALVLAAITIDPAHDTPERLAELAAGHGLAVPQARLLTGPASDVDATLDALGIVRRRAPGSELIEHDGVLIVLNREGRVAARFAADAGADEPLLRALRREIAVGK